MIEVLSPSTEQTDRTRKAKIYADEGVREYWIVDPEHQSIEVYSLSATGYDLNGKYSAGDRVLSRVFDLSLSVDQIFRS